MEVCQISIKKNHNTRVIKQPLKQLAIIAERHSGKLQLHIGERKGIFAVKVVTQLIAERLCHLMSNHLGEVVLVIQKLIKDGRQRILKGWHFSKLDDMLGKKGLRADILLKNGKHLRSNIKINVLFVKNERRLPKTILFPYQKAAVTTSQTFNLSAVIATAKSGSTEHNCFNPYENPELMEAK